MKACLKALGGLIADVPPAQTLAGQQDPAHRLLQNLADTPLRRNSEPTGQ